MPSRILCPECEAAFAYSPALLGRTVRCRQCQHTFKITAPPPEQRGAGAAESQPAEPRVPVEPPPVRLVPPPLPPTVLPDPPRRSRPPSGRDDDFDHDRPRSREHDDDDFPRSRRSRAPKSQVGSGVLFAVVAAFVFLFLVLAVGVGYLLWPTSPPTNATAQGSATANDRGAAIDPPKNLEQVMKNEPDRPGVPAPPRLAPPGLVVAPPPMPAPGPMAVPPQFDGNPRNPPLPVPPMPRPPDRPRRPAEPSRPFATAGPKFPPISPLAMQPTPLGADREERSLAGPVENAVAAGGGRLLLLHMPRQKLVAVFDVNTGKFARHIPADDSKAIIAGGMNLFIIYLPGKDVLERYNCATLERESEVKAQFGEEVLGMAMGSAANGPLAVALAGARQAPHRGATVCYFDPITGKEIRYEERRERNPFGLGNFNLRDLAIRMSANGLVATGWGAGGAIQTDVIEGGQLSHYWKLGGAESLVPTADGQALFDRGRRLNVELGEPEPPAGRPDNHWLIPAVHGEFHVALQASGGRRPTESQPWSADIHFGLEAKPLLKLADLRNLELPGGLDGRGKVLDRNVFLVPDAKLLAVVPTKKRDQLVLFRADLDKALSTAGFDYLLVTSRPPTAAVKGENYRYTLAVKSKKGGVKVTLENGPDGMTATPTGTVDWQVPKGLADTEVGVLVRVSDASGKEVFHSYRLTVKDKTEKSPEPPKK